MKTNIKNVEKLFVQEIVNIEANNYIKNNFKNGVTVICNTTEESCLQCIQTNNSMTIASINNKCNFLHLIQANIVEHNITTFSLIKKI